MKNRKQKLKNEKGYTLAEMLLTVALIIIVLGLGVIAYNQWLRTARFRHNNDVANTVFSVMQSELSERRANNNLTEIDRVLTSATNTGISNKLDGYLNVITTESGTQGTSYATMYSGYVDETGKSPIQPGPVYYVKGTKADWENYQSNHTTGSPALDAVYGILAEYMFNGDADLLDGAFCVEFDPAEGLVYSVFFSEQADELSYSASPDVGNLMNRTRDARWKYKTGNNRDLVGYCGVENLSVSTSKITTKPIVQNLTLYNENTLHLDFNLSIRMATDLMTYKITLFDAENDKRLVDIEMNGILSQTDSPTAEGNAIYNLQHFDNATDGKALVDCRVKRYDSTGMSVAETSIMTFPAWVDSTGKITLVLDALDYWTADEDLQAAYGEFVRQNGSGELVPELSNTFSIYRLGIQNTDNIYCAVYATGGGFSTTATKKSNNANRAFYASDTDKHTFEMANARHLNNMRFEETAAAAMAETLAEPDSYSYKVYGNINLTGTPVYSNYTNKPNAGYSTTTGWLTGGTPVLTDAAKAGTFPSFATLGKNSTLSSKEITGQIARVDYALMSFRFTKDANIDWMGFAAESDTDTKGTGLFIENAGTIENIKLTDVTVDGVAAESGRGGYAADRTGAFCGTNAGTLENLETVASQVGKATVTGENYVGGIFGYFEKPEDTDNITIKTLTNAAAVTGTRYVGGIVGLMSGTEKNGGYTVVIDGCENYGAVTGKTGADSALVPAYIGGIVGLVDTAAVKNCVSNPQGAAPSQDTLSGYCVGGIAGFAYDTMLDGSNTKLKAGSTRGYVAGDRYVGGIVGLCVGKSVISGAAGNLAVNDVNVVGNNYVGGIVGCNANIEVLPEGSTVKVGETEFAQNEKAKQIVAYIQEFKDAETPWYAKENLKPELLTPLSETPDENQIKSITVQYWNNQGTVIGYQHYAGGITGYNTGTVYDCISSVYQNEETHGTCEYAGGIAGYNNGTLSKGANASTATLDVVCYITGKNYVGGIVGYNDVDATVNNYRVTGGTVKGLGSFVGGYAGFNASEKLLQQEVNGTYVAIRVEANLNKIEGKYAVGGTIGGNIVPTQAAADDNVTVLAQFNVNNRMGTIVGDAAVGGYIGFNAVPAVSGEASSYRDTLRTQVSKAAEALYNQFLDTVTEKPQNVLSALENAAKLEENPAAVGTVRLVIGNEDPNKVSVTYSSALKGKIAVGGIIGYSSDDTYLLIQNVENKVLVTATESVPARQLTNLVMGLQSSALNNGKEQYSLVGGIIGIVNQKTELLRCRNYDIGDVNGVGTYVGGLAEASTGKITKCEVVSVGSAGHDFVGGLVGMNFGKITGTSALAATVTGQNYTGGIVAENYGELTLDGNITGLAVQGNGDFTGGIVGYNGVATDNVTTGTITMTNGATVTVSSTGSNVGGVVGHNAAGGISTVGATVDASVKGTVTGADMVGGLVGLHDSGTLSQLVNAATVTATGNGGNAAGIVGKLGIGTDIVRCINTGTVTATAGNAAGIVGENNAKVEYCANYNTVTAPKGAAGGICVTNKGDGQGILYCAVPANIPENSKEWWNDFPEWMKNLVGEDKPNISVQGYTNAGGIVANNNGTVSESILRNVTVENYPNSPSTSLVGGLVGTNNAGATLTLTEENAGYRNVLVRTNANGSSVGGVAGSNSGTIQGNGAVLGGTIAETSGGDVPNPDYTIYEYIVSPASGKNTEGCYINTGYKPSYKTKVVFDGYVINGDTALFGSRDGNKKQQYTIQGGVIDNKTYRVAYNGAEIAVPVDTFSIGRRAVFTMTNTKMQVAEQDGTVLNIQTYSGSKLNSSYPLYICAMNTNNAASNLGSVRMYKMEIYEDDVLLHTYLPAMNNNTREIGVLDVDADGNLTFIKYQQKSTTLEMSLWNEQGHYTPDATVTTTTNITLATGSAVTAASIGNVAGVNAQGATIQNITAQDCQWVGTLALLGGDSYGYGGIAGLNDGTIQNSSFSGAVQVTGSSAAIANVGGIAGKNQANGSITECTVGVDGNTVVQATEYGYVGGLTGWNFGSILSCNSASGENINTVQVHNNHGHVGGLVGYEAPGSYLSGTKAIPTATGAGWMVNSDGYSNDCGTGGIIGYSESGNRSKVMAYVVNNAAVAGNGTGGNNMAIGGIIGRFQNNENDNMVLSHCENKGSITGTGGTTLVGGMVGRIKYLGAAFQSCRNTGELSGSTAGGMMGDVYQNTSKNLFSGCVNTGKIEATSLAGGILGGDYGGSIGVRSDFIDCVNAGTLSSSSACGIVGKLSNNGTSFIRCRNYGQVNNSNTGYGMADTTLSSVTFTDCFDFRTTNSKLTQSTKVTDSYFYSGALTGAAATNLQGWLDAGKQLNSETAVKAENSGLALYPGDSSINGLPLSYIAGTEGWQLTSYKVGTVTSNPVAGIGIPKYVDATLAKPADLTFVTMETPLLIDTPTEFSLVEQYYRDKYATLPDSTSSAVKNLVLTQTGDKLSATWTAVSGAYGYKVCYEIVNKEGSTEHYYRSNIVYGTSWAVNIPEEWVGKTINLHVKAVTGADDAWEAADSTDKEDLSDCYWDDSAQDTNWETQSKRITTILPAPEVYLELDGVPNGGTATTGNYIAVLRNTAAYDAYLRVNDTQSIEIKVTASTASFTINYTKGDKMSAHSTKDATVGSGAANITLTAKATASMDGSTVSTSGETNQQAWLVRGATLKSTTVLQAESLGFTDTLPAELAFGVKLTALSYTKEAFLYQQTELITERALNDTVSIPMVVSGNTTRRTGTDDSLSIVLDNLPESLLEDKKEFSVYSYPWYGQNNAIYFGHTVKSDIGDAQTLLQLTDPDRNGEKVFAMDAETGKITLKSGYVVYQNVAEDGSISYEVRYSALLANQDKYTNNINVATYSYDQEKADGRNGSNQVTVSGDVTTGTDTNSWLVQPVPVIAHSEEVTDAYKFTWKDSLVDASGIVTNDGKVDKNGSYYLQLYGIDANAPDTRILLKTTAILTSDSKDDKNGSCYTDADGWQYTFTDDAGNWNYGTIILRVTKVGTVSSGITKVWPYYSECEIKQKQRFTTMSAPTVSVPDDRGDMNYNLSWNNIPGGELQNADFLCYEVQVQDTASGGASATWYVTEGEGGSAVLSKDKPTSTQRPSANGTMIDMDDFQGCKVTVSMRALAIDGSTIYRDGAAGVARTLEIASRLPVPNPASYLSMTPVYDADSYTPRADIVANGLKLTMQQDSQYASSSGRYELALEIYDAEGATLLYTVDMDALPNAFMDGYFNSGNSTFTVPNTLMTTGGETIHLADLAGKYLQVNMRATSENDISSNWTKRGDYPAAQTRIPKMQLTEPSIVDAGTVEKTYPVFGIPTVGEEEQIKGELTAKQQVFSWANDPTDAGYTIHLTRSTSQSGETAQRSAIELNLVRQNDGTLKLGDTVLTTEPTELKEYAIEVRDEAGMGGYAVVYTTIKSYISLDGEGNILLCLPDNTVQDTAFAPFNATGAWTRNLTVQTMAEKEDPYYVSSKGAYLSRTSNEVDAGWRGGTVDKMEDLAVAVKEADTSATAKQVPVTLAYNEDAQKLQIDFADIGSDNYRAMLTLQYKDSDGKEQVSKPYAMAASDNDGNHSTFDPATMAEDWAEITGATIRLIAVSNNELFGAWSEPFTLDNSVYKISYNLDGGQLPDGAANRTSYTAASAPIEIAAPEQDGFDFAGWTGSDIPTPPAESFTIPTGTTGAKSYTATWAARLALQSVPLMAASEGASGMEPVVEPTAEAQPAEEPEKTPTEMPEDGSEETPGENAAETPAAAPAETPEQPPAEPAADENG